MTRSRNRLNPLTFIAAASFVTLLYYGVSWGSPARWSDDPAPDTQPQQSETETLRERIRQLEQDLAAARERIKILETVPTGVAPPTAAPADVTAANALTSETHFLKFARDSYATEFGPKEGEPEVAPGDPARQKRIERWAAAMTREWRKPVRWLVRHGKPEVLNDGLVIRVTVLDETTFEPIGSEFDLVLDPKQTRQYSERVGRILPPERWMLHAIFAPRFIVNMERMDQGIFDKPPFIGPGVELRYDLVVSSFVQAKAAPPEKTLAPKPSDAAPAKPSS